MALVVSAGASSAMKWPEVTVMCRRSGAHARHRASASKPRAAPQSCWEDADRHPEAAAGGAVGSVVADERDAVVAEGPGEAHHVCGHGALGVGGGAGCGGLVAGAVAAQVGAWDDAGRPLALRAPVTVRCWHGWSWPGGG